METVFVDNSRIRQLNNAAHKDGPVAYWMSRDQRIEDNWALLYARQLASERNTSLVVIFNLVPEFLGATLRQYDFMLRGLRDLESRCRDFNIPFHLLIGLPAKTISEFITSHQCGVLVTDFSPLRIYRQWKANISQAITIPFCEVDAHNIVPCWLTSPKQEFAARTIRPKIHRQLNQYLEEFPALSPMAKTPCTAPLMIDWEKARMSLKINEQIRSVDWLQPGESAAHDMLAVFLTQKLSRYATARNDPALDGLSNLSPYLHFGQISAQRIALEIEKTATDKESAEAFLEELIVRRELSDNYCYYNEYYDSMEGLPDWARKTLDDHRSDPREYTYSVEEFESAHTHDPSWNAAQMEVLRTGKMHGYMRMYWAKKILEWSPSPEDAIQTAIYLNDKYELDGRDPNGYAGVLWAVGGLHDRPWFERPVYGKIRYMNANGLRRKFDVDAYIRKIERY